MSLVAEAMKKSGLVWIAEPGADRPVATWHHWRGEAAYVIASRPNGADRVAVTVRSKSTGGRLVTWMAAVTRVQPGSTEWDEVVPEIHAARLNSPPVTEETVLLRLDPTGEEER